MNPVVIRTSNLRVVIYTNDHAPPHVHVFSTGRQKEARFYIETLECYYSRGFSKKQLNDIRRSLEHDRDVLLDAWNEYHGDDEP